MNIRANNVSLSINGRRILSNVTLLAEGGKMNCAYREIRKRQDNSLELLGIDTSYRQRKNI